MNVGQYIKQLRVGKGLTQEEVGTFVGVQRAAVQKWESGMTQNIKRNVLQKLAELFNVPASSFIAEIILNHSDKPSAPAENKENSLLPVYLSFAQSAQDEGILPEDIEMALRMIEQLKKRGDN